MHVNILYNEDITAGKIKLMIVTEDLYSYLLAVKIKKKYSTVEVHLSTYDLPWTYNNSKVNNKIIKKIFYSQIKWIDSADFVSDAMANLIISGGFDGSYNITHAAIDVCTLNIDDLQIESSVLKRNKVRFAFAGNLRFKKELIYFANSLSDNCFIASEVHCFTSYVLDTKGIVTQNYIDNNKRLIKELSNYDYGFVPMSFDVVDCELVKTSFPSKSYAYLCSGLPLFVLAPKYSAISKVVEQYDIGVVCDSIDPDDITTSVELISKKDYSKNIANYLKKEKENQQALKRMLN